MIRYVFLIWSLLSLVTSCTVVDRAVPPEMASVAGTHAGGQCSAIFATERWEFVHSITFRFEGGGEGEALGVLALDGKDIHCALVTVEGLTLFEARVPENGPVQVARALPPFDKPELAEGLMGDVRTIFQSPPGSIAFGHLLNGAPICRFSAVGKVTDILPQDDGCWSMQTYGEPRGDRNITTHSCKIIHSIIIPETIHLVSSGPTGYSLDMHLISAQKLKSVY